MKKKKISLVNVESKNISLKNPTNKKKFTPSFKEIKNPILNKKNNNILQTNQPSTNDSSNHTKIILSNKKDSLNNINNNKNNPSKKDDSLNINKNSFSKKSNLFLPISENLFQKKTKNYSELKEIKERNKLTFHKFLTFNQYSNIIKIFPSKKILSVNGRSIIIFKINNSKFEIIQTIQKAHNNEIIFLSIKDDNNFITSSYDDLIKIWNKKKNEQFFINYMIIENSHKSWIYCLIYYGNDKIITSSHDDTIKFWNIKNNNYQCISVIKNDYSVDSLFLLENKNILISSGGDGLKMFDLIEIKCIKENENAYSIGKSEIIKFNDDKIILKGDLDERIKIINIDNLEIYKCFCIGFKCYGVCIFEDVILFCGKSNDLKIYNYNFECVEVINNFCNQAYGLCKFNDFYFLSYDRDEICLWKKNFKKY